MHWIIHHRSINPCERNTIFIGWIGSVNKQKVIIDEGNDGSGVWISENIGFLKTSPGPWITILSPIQEKADPKSLLYRRNIEWDNPHSSIFIAENIRLVDSIGKYRVYTSKCLKILVIVEVAERSYVQTFDYIFSYVI